MMVFHVMNYMSECQNLQIPQIIDLNTAPKYVKKWYKNECMTDPSSQLYRRFAC